ncbi:MAG: biopolymer transporter ExbD [Phycisphaeraceae bacterium]|nr:biopolymer transporter ExbD [Phycisphaeraceae bacterium]
MSFASESRERTRPVLPLSAMVDILFLLLIFFMTASVFREAETQIPISLPVADQAEAGDQSASKIRISFDDSGAVFLGEHRIELDNLDDTLRQLAAEDSAQIVEIRGDQQGNYGLAIRLMDIARSAGLTDIRLATVKPRSEAGQ